MPTVEINILWDGAACCFQIARIFIYFAALYKWNIQFAATSDVCHDYSAALCVICQLHFVVTFTYMSILLKFCCIAKYQFDYSTAFCLACYFITVQYVFVRFSPFRYVDINRSSIANMHGATQILLVCVL